MSNLICHHCNGKIAPGANFLNALGHPYHQEHFVCRRCNSALGTAQFFNVNNEAICATCYSTHDVPTCSQCRRPLLRGQDFLRYEGESFHNSCFTCNNCGKELHTTEFYKQEGKRYCNHCVDQVSRSHSSGGHSTPSHSSNTSSHSSGGGGNNSYVPHYPAARKGSTYEAVPVNPSKDSSATYRPGTISNSSSYDSKPTAGGSSYSSSYGGNSGGGSGGGSSTASTYKSPSSAYSSSYSSEPAYQSAIIEETVPSYSSTASTYQSHSTPKEDNNNFDFSAEIDLDITPPAHDHNNNNNTHSAYASSYGGSGGSNYGGSTYGGSGGGGSSYGVSATVDVPEVSLDSILSDLENSGTDFNRTYSTYKTKDDDSDLQDILRDLESPY